MLGVSDVNMGSVQYSNEVLPVLLKGNEIANVGRVCVNLTMANLSACVRCHSSSQGWQSLNLRDR